MGEGLIWRWPTQETGLVEHEMLRAYRRAWARGDEEEVVRIGQAQILRTPSNMSMPVLAYRLRNRFTSERRGAIKVSHDWCRFDRWLLLQSGGE